MFLKRVRHVWSAVDLVVEIVRILAVWTSAEKDESKGLIPSQVDGSFDLRNFLSAARRLVRCSQEHWITRGRRAARAGLEERGQMSSRQEVKVEHKVFSSCIHIQR